MSGPTSQPDRQCRRCGVKLSRYNPESLCWSCQKETQAMIPETTSPFPTLSSASRSGFILRSILDTVRRTKPLHFSDVGQALKQFRSVHHLTQRELAALLEFDQSYISKLENGQGLRDIATLQHIADRLGIPGQWLGLSAD